VFESGIGTSKMKNDEEINALRRWREAVEARLEEQEMRLRRLEAQRDLLVRRQMDAAQKNHDHLQ
jgi:hypothetical protein